MKKINIWLLIVLLLGANFALAQESFNKMAQTGCQFLSVGTNARSVGSAEAFTAIEGGSNSLFYNPAGMARMNNYLDLNANTMQFIADINYYSGSLAINPFGIQYGVLGFSFMSVDYGEIQGTRVDPDPENLKGYTDTEILKPSAMAFGVGYAIQLSDRFSVGLQVKYVYQSLGESYLDDDPLTAVSNKINVLAFDFGTLYQTGIKSLAFGMSIRNFSQEVKYQDEAFQLPLTFKLGVSMDAMDILDPDTDLHSLMVAVDAVHNRDYNEQINLGLDYTFNKMFSVRLGYMFGNDEYGFTAGVGVQQFGLGFDYGYMPFEHFDSVHRLTIRYSY